MADYMDALEWLEDRAAEGSENAQAVLDAIRSFESGENTVIGMCMARRPHDEIRDAVLARSTDRL